MNILHSFKNLMKSITDSFARIFKANDDDYQDIGVQPYEKKVKDPNYKQ